MIYGLRLASLPFAVLALIPAGAHLFSMNNKLRLGRTDYLVAQRAYDGWSLFAIGALLSTLLLSLWLYRAAQPIGLTVAAFLCIVSTQVIFWRVTYPANNATENWTTMPEGLSAAQQWEYSHAAGAVLNFIALFLLMLSVLRTE